MKNQKTKNLAKFSWLIVLLAALLACGVPSVFGPKATPTSTATETNTPIPPSPTIDPATLTAEAVAAQATLDAQATQDAQATANVGLAATKTAMAPYELSLIGLGMDPNAGQLFVADPSVSQNATGYKQYINADQFPGAIGKDIAMQADITWDTQYGDAGCGFIFRSSGSQDKPDQYIVTAVRGLSGHVYFKLWNKGLEINNADFFPKMYDRKFNTDHNSTNRLAIVAKGNKILIFTNGVLIGEVDPTKMPKPPEYPIPPDKPDDPNDKELMIQYKQELDYYNKTRNELKQNYDALLYRFKNGQTDLPAGTAYLTTYAGGGDVSCQFANAWLFVSNATP